MKKKKEYLRDDLAHETQEVRHSREDLSLTVLGTGPVTVFSSQKKLDDASELADGDDRQRCKAPPVDVDEHQQDGSKKQPQFYFGMSPGDVAVATAEEQLQRRSEPDLEEESRRVMEEFDAVLAEKKSEELVPIRSYG